MLFLSLDLILLNVINLRDRILTWTCGRSVGFSGHCRLSVSCNRSGVFSCSNSLLVIDFLQVYSFLGLGSNLSVTSGWSVFFFGGRGGGGVQFVSDVWHVGSFLGLLVVWLFCVNSTVWSILYILSYQI